jgi:hypothetical protein
MDQFPNPSIPSGQGQAAGNILQYSPDQILLVKNIRPDIVIAYDDKFILDRGVAADMKSMGREEVTTTTENYHYQTGSYFTSATVGFIASSSAASITFQVNAVGASGYYASPGNVGDSAILGNDKFSALVTAKTGTVTDAVHTITLSRGDSTDFALNDTTVIAFGDEVSFPFSSQVAGQDFPDGVAIRDTRFKTNLHYMMTATDEIIADMANQEQNIMIGTDGSTQYYIGRQRLALTVRSQVKKAFAVLFANGANYSATVDGVSKAFTTTTGLYPTADQFATKLAITPGLMDIDDLYTIAQQARRGLIGNELIAYIGPNRKQEWDTLFGTFFQNGAVVYDSFANKYDAMSGGTKPMDANSAMEHGVSLGYKSVNLLDISVHTKIPVEFDHNVIAKGNVNDSYYRQSILLMQASNGTISFNGKTMQGLSFGLKVREGVTAFGGGRARVRVYDQNPANFGNERFKETLIEEFGVTTYNAQKMILVTK